MCIIDWGNGSQQIKVLSVCAHVASSSTTTASFNASKTTHTNCESKCCNETFPLECTFALLLCYESYWAAFKGKHNRNKRQSQLLQKLTMVLPYIFGINILKQIYIQMVISLPKKTCFKHIYYNETRDFIRKNTLHAQFKKLYPTNNFRF